MRAHLIGWAGQVSNIEDEWIWSRTYIVDAQTLRTHLRRLLALCHINVVFLALGRTYVVFLALGRTYVVFLA